MSDQDPVVPVPPQLGETQAKPLGQSSGSERLCNFCHGIYDSKKNVCPHCGKPFPRMPAG